jgi:hypothetical protein
MDGNAAGGCHASGADSAMLPARSTARTTTVAAVAGGNAATGTATSKLVCPVPAGDELWTSPAARMTVPVAASLVANVTARHGPSVAIVTPVITGGVVSGTADVSKAPMRPVVSGWPAPSSAPGPS